MGVTKRCGDVGGVEDPPAVVQQVSDAPTVDDSWFVHARPSLRLRPRPNLMY
jgi:hypothetical protein